MLGSAENVHGKARPVHDGIARIKAIGADVVLIDPQFAPKVIVKSDAEEMVDLISAAAKQVGSTCFRALP